MELSQISRDCALRHKTFKLLCILSLHVREDHSQIAVWLAKGLKQKTRPDGVTLTIVDLYPTSENSREEVASGCLMS